MKITLLIIFLTFIYTILDKFILDGNQNNDEKSKSNIFYKAIKSKYTLIVLLSGLLIFQIISEYITNEANKTRDTNTNNAFDTLYLSHNTLKKVNSSVDSLFISIDSTISNTKDQLELISNLNSDLMAVRQEFNKSIQEFKTIRQEYEKQIAIEKEKIKEAKPNLELAYAKYSIDSLSFGYSFELYNSGIRLADSIKYHSLVILMDSSLILKDIVLYKTNTDEANVLSISHLDNLSNSKIFHSEDIDINRLSGFSSAYLLLTYEYKDNLTNETKNTFSIFGTRSLEKGQRQFGFNVKDFEKKSIKTHLLKNNKRLYDIFYN